MIGHYSDVVTSIIMHSQEYPFDVDATGIVKDWYEAKKPWIDLFGGQTWVRSVHPVKVYLSEEQQSRRFYDFINILQSNDILTKDLEDFLYDNKPGFFDNTVTTPRPALNIPQGAKLSKSFKKFLNGDTVRWTQDLASRFMQENKVEGYLYLSVDPVDFLTMSENSMNWDSCHSLDGDYRAGNFSYMCDKTTVVAFVAGETPIHLKCLPPDVVAFNKKWRMLIHTDLERNCPCIYYNREYPYTSEELVKYTHDLFMIVKLKTAIGNPYTNPINVGFKIIQSGDGEAGMLSHNHMVYGGRVFDTRDIIDTSDYIGYCDLISSSSYTPIAAINTPMLHEYLDNYALDTIKSPQAELEAFKRIFGIKIGAKVLCPACEEHYMNRGELFLCPHCVAEYDADEDFFLKCSECGKKIYEDQEDVYWIDGDQPCCKHCYNALCREEEIYEEEE